MLRTRHLPSKYVALSAAYDDAMQKSSGAGSDLYDCDRLEKNPISNKRLEQHPHIDQSNKRKITYDVGKKTIIVSKNGYMDLALKQKKNALKNLNKKTVITDIHGYMQRVSKRKRNIGQEPVAKDKGDNALRISQKHQVLRDSGCADLRETLLLGNPKQGDYRGDFDQSSDSKGFNMATQAWQQSNYIEDYDECLSADCLHMNSQFTCNSESLLPGGYRSDYDQTQKPTQPYQILSQRLPTMSALHKKIIDNRVLENKSDNVAHHESYRQSSEDLDNGSYGQRSDALNDSSFEEFQEGSLGNKLAGLIFMCNDRVRTNCFRHKVFGMPFSKKRLLDHVKPGTKLFLFEYEARNLWGIYEAASFPGFELENEAFNGSEVDFPLQVRFSIYKQFQPLPERQFKVAIKENYFSKGKFSFELNAEQVSKLTQLFFSGSLLGKHINKGLPQSSVPRGTVPALRFHEGLLTDNNCDKASIQERDMLRLIRRENSSGNNSPGLNEFSGSRSSNHEQNDYGVGNLSNLEFGDGGSSMTSACYTSIRGHMMKDLTKLKGDLVIKNSTKLNNDWDDPKIDSSDRGAWNDHCCNKLDTWHLREKPSCGCGRHLHDDILEEHGDALYSGLRGKGSSGGKSDTIPSLNMKDSVPLEVCLRKKNGRFERLVQHATRHVDSTVAYASLDNSEKSHSLENMSSIHAGRVNSHYTLQKPWKNEAGQLYDLKKQFEPGVSSHHATEPTISLSQCMLDNAYLDESRTKISPSLVTKCKKEVHPLCTSSSEFLQYQVSCNDGMGDTSEIKRNVSALVNVNVDYSSPRVIDNLGNIRVTVKNDTSRIDTLQNAGIQRIHKDTSRMDTLQNAGIQRIHKDTSRMDTLENVGIQRIHKNTSRMDTLQNGGIQRIHKDDSVHLNQNLLGSVPKLKSQRFVTISRLSKKSVNDLSDSNSLSKTEVGKNILQKKLPVWSRLSKQVSSTNSTIKLRSPNLKEMKHDDRNVSDKEDETDALVGEECYSPDEHEDIEDTPKEDFIIDFKRRKNIHRSEEHSKKGMSTDEVALGTSVQENNSIQNKCDIPKKRRRLIRPEIVCSYSKLVSASSNMVDKQQNTSICTVGEALEVKN
jgi:hypothetical protein